METRGKNREGRGGRQHGVSESGPPNAAGSPQYAPSITVSPESVLFHRCTGKGRRRVAHTGVPRVRRGSAQWGPGQPGRPRPLPQSPE